ncbi:MAG: IS110 family transposase [Syntrophaceae bacterium]|nr:IS110 family transposase [Syntrophaceae bacterium]NTW60225.1 IS110 family transposase [Nitrospirota bacterium]
MKHSIIFVGLDVHKDSIDIALADDGRNGEIRFYGTIGGDLASLDKAIRRFRRTGTELRFVYEAGPCGYEIYRHLTAQGFRCDVIAPSMTPKKSGDRIKTDRRDAVTLARLYRASELTPVYVPREDDEAMRDLVRGRGDAVNATRKARQRLSAFVLRHGFRYSGRKAWSVAHLRWLADIKMPHPAQQVALQEYIHSVEECSERVDRLTEQILKLVPTWRMAPVVTAFQSLRGVAPIVATTMVVEIGDLRRFENPRQLMAYLGLVPSESSSGQTTKRGGITKTGNGHARRALIEAAQAYSFPARVSRALRKRQEGLPREIKEISWKAQVRLCGRFKKLMAKGKNRNRTVTAIARELSGFMWAIAKEVPMAA